MGNERRRSPRVEILGRVHGHVASLDLNVRVREMSLGGLSMETSVQFPVGARHDFSLTLGDGAAVLLTGEIVYSRPVATTDGTKLFVTGVRFIDEEIEGPGADQILDRIS